MKKKTSKTRYIVEFLVQERQEETCVMKTTSKAKRNTIL